MKHEPPQVEVAPGLIKHSVNKIEHRWAIIHADGGYIFPEDIGSDIHLR